MIAIHIVILYVGSVSNGVTIARFFCIDCNVGSSTVIVGGLVYIAAIFLAW